MIDVTKQQIIFNPEKMFQLGIDEKKIDSIMDA